MSRVGKKPVAIPSGVTATVEGQTVKVKGPKGQLQFVVHDDVEVKFESGAVKVAPKFKTNRAQAMYGTARAQVANLVEGVTKGWTRELEIVGRLKFAPYFLTVADIVKFARSGFDKDGNPTKPILCQGRGSAATCPTRWESVPEIVISVGFGTAMVMPSGIA